MRYYKDIKNFVSGKRVFCGIDVHYNHWNLCFVCDGEVVEKLELSTDVVKLLFLFKSYRTARQINCVYEAGFSGTWLCRKLRAAGYASMITPPNLVPHSGSKVKTDKRDAQALAFYLSAGLLKSVYILPSHVEADRRVVRRRGQLVKKVTRAKNETKSFLHLHGLKKPEEIKTNWSGRYISWLKSLPFEYDVDRFLLNQYLASYSRLREELAGVTLYLRALSKNPRYSKNFKHITALRGVGLVTAMTLLLEIYAFGRFKNESHFSSYLGLTPAQYSSGDQVRLGHITRQGNAHLRNVLVESAWTVIRHCPHLREKYDRIRNKGTNGKKAIVAVARSLAVRLRRCLLDQQDYVIGIS